jgi:hypothetical protein
MVGEYVNKYAIYMHLPMGCNRSLQRETGRGERLGVRDKVAGAKGV